MKRPECPCRYCEDRTSECHKDCERYASWKRLDWKYKGLKYSETHNEINSYISERRRNGNT